MNKLLCLIICGLFTCSAFASDVIGTTAERHVKRGNQCTACHRDGNFQKPVRKEQCLACHGDYSTLAKRTEDVKPNLHYNHYGERDCATCHRGHQPSVTSCDQCHKFDLKAP